MKTQDKITINSPVSALPYVNVKVEKLLHKLGIKTIYDLLMHSPSRYLDFSNVVKVKDVPIGEICTIQGQIISVNNQRTWKRGLNITEAIVDDGTGRVRAVWFNQPFIAHRLRIEQFVNLSGKATIQKNELTFSHPAYEILGKNELAHTGMIVPVYPETAGMTSKWIRFLMKQALKYAAELQEILPAEIKAKEKFLNKKEAVKNLHFPPDINTARQAKKQLAFEELFLIQLVVLGMKKDNQLQKAPAIKADIDLVKNFLSRLPFQLTTAQKKSAWQILKDMEKPHPMNRLLNGDVGSGKTIVAAIAALNAVKQGHQVAYLAPTEILARQHFATFCKFLQPFKIHIALTTGSENKIFEPELGESYNVKKANIAAEIAGEKIGIAIGTHALLQDKIKFNNLGLVIIDEQHRFGVNQRATLLQNSKFLIPHLLSMTATPIPRTLMLTVYGDLDISIINEMPAGRQKIITKIISPKERKSAYEFIRQQVKEGRQVFVVCPRIEQATGNEQSAISNSEIKTVKEEYKKLSEEIFPNLKVAMLHGKIKPKEKEKIMTDFKDDKINILISTSVIEVGIDIPNATIMMIESAERFGLAQLHQFRGRVGRSGHQSYCFLMVDSDAKIEKDRLQAMTKSENGFELAERDLEIRGPGEFLGTRQSGIADTAFAASADVFTLEKVRKYATDLFKKDPDLQKHPLLKEKLKQIKQKVHLE